MVGVGRPGGFVLGGGSHPDGGVRPGGAHPVDSLGGGDLDGVDVLLTRDSLVGCGWTGVSFRWYCGVGGLVVGH